MKSPKLWFQVNGLSKQYGERRVQFDLTLFDYFNVELSLYFFNIRMGVDYKRLFV